MLNTIIKPEEKRARQEETEENDKTTKINEQNDKKYMTYGLNALSSPSNRVT